MDSQRLRAAGEMLVRWPRVMILSHDRPDGDALGAMGAMKRLLEAGGRHADAFIYNPLPARFQFLQRTGDFALWDDLPQGKESAARPGEGGANQVSGEDAPARVLDATYDAIVILDTCSWSQLEPVAGYLRATALPKLVIDHHVTGDDLTGRSQVTSRLRSTYASVAFRGCLTIIEPEASSTCLVVHALARSMNWPIDHAAAEALFTGMATDTGWFRFPNTDQLTLEAAGDLIAAGVRIDVMYSRLIESYSPQRLRLLAHVLGTLEFHAGGKVAMMCVTPDMFTAAGASAGDTEDMVNEPMNVGSVGVSVLLSDLGDDLVRVNLRSKSPEMDGGLDVAAVARTLGGGGHRRAAGARVPGSLGEVRRHVLEAVLGAMGEV